MKQYLSAIGLFLIIMQSCFKEDERAIPYPGEVTTISDSVQSYQSYFDFETGIVVKSHLANTWQLGFECGANGWRIITNSGANWFIYNTAQNLPDAIITMPAGVKHLYDIQHDWPDSTVVGNWMLSAENGKEYTHNIYLLGKQIDGVFANLKQISFIEVTDTTYTFFYKEQSTGLSDTVTIRKNNAVNFVYYSFNLHQQVNLEPGKESYDLVFCSYYDLATLFGLTIPYQVGGALLNVWKTEVVQDSLTAFTDIGLESIQGVDFIRQRDIPGYRWKTVAVDVTGGGTATYSVKTNYNYIFHTAQDNYFKLRFLSYTLDGSSGFPRFEFRQLR